MTTTLTTLTTLATQVPAVRGSEAVIPWATKLFDDAGDLGVAAGKTALIVGFVVYLVKAGSKIGAILLGGAIMALGWWFLNNATSSDVQEKIKDQVGTDTGLARLTDHPDRAQLVAAGVVHVPGRPG